MENPDMTQKNSKILVATAGEALIDLIRAADGRLDACIGGAVYNLTRALARQDVGTLYLNPLSGDRFGRMLAEGLIEDGVHLAEPQPVQQVTSLAVVSVDANGLPDYAFYREGVSDRATSAARLMQACASQSDLAVVCTGALALSPDDANTYLPWLKAQRDAGKLIVMDANMRPSVMPDIALYRKHVRTALQFAHVIKVSDEDLENLCVPGTDALSRAKQLLQDSKAHFVALTQGGDGASLITRAGQVFTAKEGAPLVIEDTVGAGDCFLAGLVVAMLEGGLDPAWGKSPVQTQQAEALLQSAISSASLCVQRRGCVPPTRAEVRQQIAKGSVRFFQGRPV